MCLSQTQTTGGLLGYLINSLFQGDTIKVLMQQDMWWQGKLSNGEQGWFPSAYVKVTDSASPSNNQSESK